MRFFLFPFLVYSLLDAPEEGEAEEGRMGCAVLGCGAEAPQFLGC